MIVQRWEVVAHCRECNTPLRVDLKVIAIVRGLDYVLWNKTARCKRLLCNGVVDFKAKCPETIQYEPLTFDDREPL